MLIDSRINARRKAFTLIELLIVVAIIAILAAIAVPNFLEAQIRAKVSRVKNDMRTNATGLEAYAVDYGKYIPCYHGGAGLTLAQVQARLGDQFTTEFGGNGDCYDYFDVCGRALTTPVAYLNNISHPSPFQVQSGWFSQRSFFFAVMIPYGPLPDSVPTPNGKDSSYGDSWVGFDTMWGNGSAQWFQMDGGPDGDWFGWPVNNPAGQYDVQAIYDPTNGTVSWGNIWKVGGGRTQ